LVQRARIGFPVKNESWPSYFRVDIAYNPLVAIKLYRYRDWPAAERAFRRGLELNPNVAELHQHYALCLILFGRNEDARKEIQLGAELNPVSFPLQSKLGENPFPHATV
jgi:tetratricopeptide (TPR) repeat protein